MSEVVSDEPAVLGEPASRPHHAAVVGEPPEEMVPVLGEPVLLANGLQNDQQPVSSSSLDQPAINGVHDESSSALEPPCLFSDAPSSTASSVEGPITPMVEDQAASAEEVTSPVLPESITEAPNVVPDGPDSAHNVDDANNEVNTSADVEVTHILDVPSDPSPPERDVSTENPFSALDEDSTGSNLKVSVEGEERAVVDDPSEADQQAISAVEKEESTKGVDPCVVDSQEPPTTSHEEITEGSGSTADSSENSTAILANKEPTTESDETTSSVSREIKVSEATKADELNLADSQQVDTSTKEFDVGRPSPDEAGGEALDSTKELASTKDGKGQVYDKIGEDSTKAGATLSEVEHVESREASLPEAISKGDVYTEDGEAVDAATESSHSEAEKVVSREAVLPEAYPSEKVGGEDQAAPDSSVVHIDKDASAEAFPMESPGVRAIEAEASTCDQLPSNEAALGENGFQHKQDGIPSEKDQCLTKDEKSSSRFKVPVICTLAIAVVGVAVAAISRSRQ
ncbi:hypothetical protein GOP47_0017335 [Adiantum capillus-veneris]|uniref:Uncharacterized protein n=1 Tax=Adiantum capillus-veneris TaxID=13818 RepID=A0A9D4UFN1_ADICA|nr:hypothetical protein GOP47_0017335 [Adiantum capillus-veneris]